MSGLGTKKFCFCILKKVLEPIRACVHTKEVHWVKDILMENQYYVLGMVVVLMPLMGSVLVMELVSISQEK